MAGIWAQVLGLDRVGRDQGFFELGGHSLLILRLQSRIREHTGMRVSVVDLFRFPTVASLSEHLGGDKDADAAPAPRRGSERAAKRRALAAGRGAVHTNESTNGEGDR